MEKTKPGKWVLRFIILYVVYLILYCGYLYFVMDVRITKKIDIQENYGQFLTDIQDEMVEHSLNFAALVEDTNRMYTDEEKAQIEQSLIDQNELLKKAQINSPNITNEDYLPIYKDILKIFSFYIQGEIMQAEYIYKYRDDIPAEDIPDAQRANLETYTMGVSLCNMMGNMMLNNYTYINDVRDLEFESKFEVMPLEETVDSNTEENRTELKNASRIEDLLND